MSGLRHCNCPTLEKMSVIGNVVMAIYQKLDEEQEINQTNRVIEGNRMENRIY